MDIEKPVLYWVKQATGTPDAAELWGMPLACTYGLGGDSRSYRGKVALLSASSRSEADLSIVQVHVNGKGFHLGVKSAAPVDYPEAPFLITDHLPLHFVRQQTISFEPTQMWVELEQENDSPGEYFVCCPEWMGMLHVDKNRSTRRGVLWIFSDRREVIVAPGTPLAFCADPEEVFAHVTDN